MNKNVLIAVVVIIILLVGGLFILGRKSSSPSQMENMNMAPTNSTGTTSTTNTTAPSVTQPSAVGNAVTIQNFSFSPSTITIHPGDSITWTNMDSAPHSATADDGSFDTGVLQKGQSKTLKFSSMGTFTYHCSVHPSMKAKVVVQ